MNEVKTKSDWKFDFRSEASVKDLAGSVVRAENLCKFLVDHLPLNCASATHFAVSNLLVIAEHSLSCVRNMLVEYQRIFEYVPKSDQGSKAGSAE